MKIGDRPEKVKTRKSEEGKQKKKKVKKSRCERAEEIRGDRMKRQERQNEEATKQRVKKRGQDERTHVNRGQGMSGREELISVLKVTSQSELLELFSLNRVSVNELISGKHSKCTL